MSTGSETGAIASTCMLFQLDPQIGYHYLTCHQDHAWQKCVRCCA